MALPINRFAQAAQARARIAGVLVATQLPVTVGASTGLAHLPDRYDKDAVQIALDDLVSLVNSKLGQEVKGG